MTLAEINAHIQKIEPLVELFRGEEGYHYYVFDNMAVRGDGRLVYETESVMVPYLKNQKPAVWIADGIEFGRTVREKRL